jgi:hypothetical protein
MGFFLTVFSARQTFLGPGLARRLAELGPCGPGGHAEAACSPIGSHSSLRMPPLLLGCRNAIRV